MVPSKVTAPLEFDALLAVDLAEFGRGTALAGTEDTVEIAEVVKAAAETDFLDAVDGVNQFTSDKAQTDINDIVAEGLAGMLAEETAERGGRHANQVGQRGQTNLVHIVFLNILLILKYTATVALNNNFGIG